MSGFMLLVWLIFAASLAFAELLIMRRPKLLKRIASDNCYRIDGSRSQRRAALEAKSHRKLRSDMWAVFAIAAISGCGLCGAIHFFIIPIPLAWNAALSFDPNQDVWQEKLLEPGADADQYLRWLRRDRSVVSHEDQQSVVRLLWKVWPLVLVIAAIWLAITFKFAVWGFRRSFSEYTLGLLTRQEENLELDLARMRESP